MFKFAVLGGLGRDLLVAENLLKYGNHVLVISEQFNPGLASFSYEHYSFVVCRDEKVTIQFLAAYEPQCIICMDERKVTPYFYAQLNSVCHFLFMPSPKTILIEQDKQGTKKLAEEIDSSFVNKSIKLCTQESLFQKLRYYDHYVLRINRASTSNVYFDEVPPDAFNLENKVFLEKYIVGFDFTIPCFFVQNKMIYCPVLFDMPNRKIDGKIRKTSGMGAVSLRGVNEKTKQLIANAKLFMDKFTRMLAEKYNSYNLFLSYQFRVDAANDQVYFTEIDMKPGEPELINTIMSDQKFNFGAVLEKFFEGTLSQSDISPDNSKNVFCITVTSKSYPNKSGNLTFLGNTLLKCENLYDDIFWCRAGINKLGEINCLDSRMLHFVIESASLKNVLERYRILASKINDCGLGIINYEEIEKVVSEITL